MYNKKVSEVGQQKLVFQFFFFFSPFLLKQKEVDHFSFFSDFKEKGQTFTSIINPAKAVSLGFITFYSQYLHWMDL